MKLIYSLLNKLSIRVLILLILVFTNTEALTLARCSKNENQRFELDTTSGKLSGFCDFVELKHNNPREAKSSNVFTWLGVPYAEPPVGSYRFKRPIEVRKRSETIDATKWPNSCVQENNHNQESLFSSKDSKNNIFAGHSMWSIDSKHSKISEDCLYLNIWVPGEAYYSKLGPQPPDSIPDRHPIIVFFHGGGTVRGSSTLDIYNPSSFVAATNTIFITVNYRLGVFGFLYLENEFPGNQALLDQNEALRWIKNNAEKFGGDSNKITIYGHSAGAMLTGLHLFYKDSWQYFRNAILQGGTPLINQIKPITRSEANRRTKELLSRIGCQSNAESDLALCAQNSANIDRESINYFNKMNNYNHYTSSYTFSAFVPVLDGHVLAEDPLESLKTGNFKKCPIITGFTTDEGTMFAAYSGLLGNKLEDIEKQQTINHTSFVNFVKDYLHYYPYYPQVGNDLLYNSILFEYTKMVNEKNDDGILYPLVKPNYFHALTKMLGDLMFKCPAYRFVDLLAKHNTNVYLYLFAHRLSSTPWPTWYGATHGDDLAFTFAHPISSRQQDSIVGVNPWANPKHRYSNGEKLLTTEIINYWSNFAWYNTPNHKKSNKYWPEYTLLSFDNDADNMTDPNESNKYVILKTNGTKINRGYSLETCQFWNSYLPSLLNENNKQIEYARSQTPAPAPCQYSATKQSVKVSQSLVVEKSNNNSIKLNSYNYFSVILYFVFIVLKIFN